MLKSFSNLLLAFLRLPLNFDQDPASILRDVNNIYRVANGICVSDFTIPRQAHRNRGHVSSILGNVSSIFKTASSIFRNASSILRNAEHYAEGIARIATNIPEDANNVPEDATFMPEVAVCLSRYSKFTDTNAISNPINAIHITKNPSRVLI